MTTRPTTGPSLGPAPAWVRESGIEVLAGVLEDARELLLLVNTETPGAEIKILWILVSPKSGGLRWLSCHIFEKICYFFLPVTQ